MKTHELRVNCFCCGDEHRIKVNTEGWHKWKAGMYIQDAMPDLTADQRELLISQTCKGCFDEMMKEEEMDSEEQQPKPSASKPTTHH